MDPFQALFSSASLSPYVQDGSRAPVALGGNLSPEGGVTCPDRRSVAYFEPKNWRLSDLGRVTMSGIADRRLEVQLIADPSASVPGVSGGGQTGVHASWNRSTRVTDACGRAALLCSMFRVVDSADELYAGALPQGASPLGRTEEEDMSPVGGVMTGKPLPPGIEFHDAGIRRTAGGFGAVSQTQPSVSIHGVTWFGQGAVNAAKDALAAGGSLNDALRWARAASTGRPRPALMDAGTTAAGGAGGGPLPIAGGSDGGGKKIPNPVKKKSGEMLPPPPQGYVASPGLLEEDSPTGGSGGGDTPGRIVHSGTRKKALRALRAGVLETFFHPPAAIEDYAIGNSGTRIGPLVGRTDAQWAMGPVEKAGAKWTGKIRFVDKESPGMKDGKPFAGNMQHEAGYANNGHHVADETCEWVPVIRVDAGVPASRPPWIDPRRKESWIDPREDEEPPLFPPGWDPLDTDVWRPDEGLPPSAIQPPGGGLLDPWWEPPSGPPIAGGVPGLPGVSP